MPSPQQGIGLRLTEAELVEITDYHQPTKQLQELHEQGFWRARRAPISGKVILERAHYEAVCAGQDKPDRNQRRQQAPKLASELKAA